jgi:hypothetical protein
MTKKTPRPPRVPDFVKVKGDKTVSLDKNGVLENATSSTLARIAADLSEKDFEKFLVLVLHEGKDERMIRSLENLRIGYRTGYDDGYFDASMKQSKEPWK